MLSSKKKDKNRRTLVKKFEIKRLQAKVFSQDLTLKNFVSSMSIDSSDNSKEVSINPITSDKSNVIGNTGSVYKYKVCKKMSLKKFHSSFVRENKTNIIQNLLMAIPRNSSKTRVKNRCIESGRSRAVLRFCKLSRIVLREKASEGVVPGISKASW